MSETNAGISTLNLTVTASTFDYLRRLVELGAVEGAPGEQRPGEGLLVVLQAMHHVLAGGHVQVTIDQKGNPDLVAQLEGLQQKSFAEANTVNGRAGAFVITTP